MQLEHWAHIAEIISPVLIVLTWAINRRDFFDVFRRRWKLILPAFVIVALYALWVRGYFMWLFNRVTLPVLELIVFAVLLLALPIGLWFLVHALQENVKQLQPTPEPLRPDPRNFVNDEILGVMWHWRYDMSGMLDVDSLLPICPGDTCRNRLDMRTDFQRYSNMRPNPYGPPVSFVCSRCHFTREFDYSWIQLQQDLGKEIERRINIGEYAQRIQKL
jgi:hypothetical protein